MILSVLVSQIFFTAGKKPKSLAGLIDCSIFFFIMLLSLQHPMEIRMAWRLSTLSLSSSAWCEDVCVLQSATKMDLFHSLKYSDRWRFLTGSTLFFKFFRKGNKGMLQPGRGEDPVCRGHRLLLMLPRWLLAVPCLYLSIVFWLVWAIGSLGKDCPNFHGTTCSWTCAFHCWKGNTIAEVVNSFKNQNLRGYLLFTTYGILCLWTHQFHILSCCHTQQYWCSYTCLNVTLYQAALVSFSWRASALHRPAGWTLSGRASACTVSPNPPSCSQLDRLQQRRAVPFV